MWLKASGNVSTGSGGSLGVCFTALDSATLTVAARWESVVQLVRVSLSHHFSRGPEVLERLRFQGTQPNQSYLRRKPERVTLNHCAYVVT